MTVAAYFLFRQNTFRYSDFSDNWFICRKKKEKKKKQDLRKKKRKEKGKGKEMHTK